MTGDLALLKHSGVGVTGTERTSNYLILFSLVICYSSVTVLGWWVFLIKQNGDEGEAITL